MAGLSLKEALLALFLAIAFVKHHLLSGSNSDAPIEPGKTQIESLQAATIPASTQYHDVHKLGHQPMSGKATEDVTALSQCQLNSEWSEAIRSQSPVVLQNMTNKAAYNGHVGRIVNCTNSRLLVAVHGVFFDAVPAKVWVKRWHVRLLERPLSHVSHVDMSKIQVRASSTRGDFPLHVVLEDDDRKWWISKPGSFFQGRGEEYLEFEFGTSSTARVMGISIPPMPMGPLSVREFSVEAFLEQEWKSVSPRLQTLDRVGLQEVALQMVETRHLRVKCFASAAPMDSVGLFQIGFL